MVFGPIVGPCVRNNISVKIISSVLELSIFSFFVYGCDSVDRVCFH
jgi:hypothetical protein